MQARSPELHRNKSVSVGGGGGNPKKITVILKK